jgi:hypothetical protein
MEKWELRTPPTIRRLTPSCRHQLSWIAPPRPLFLGLGEARLAIGPTCTQTLLTDTVDGTKQDFKQVHSHCGALRRVKVSAEHPIGFADRLNLP